MTDYLSKQRKRQGLLLYTLGGSQPKTCVAALGHNQVDSHQRLCVTNAVRIPVNSRLRVYALNSVAASPSRRRNLCIRRATAAMCTTPDIHYLDRVVLPEMLGDDSTSDWQQSRG